MAEFDCREVTLYGWRKIKMQLLTNHYGNNSFIQWPFLIVLYVSITFVVGSPANLVNMF